MPIVGEGLIVIRCEKDILRLQVCVNQIKVMQNCSQPSAKFKASIETVLTSNTRE